MQQLSFNISQALRTISSNLLRSIITILIITLGITALVGILTATDVMREGVSSNFSSMGSNSFQLSNEIVKKSKKKNGPGRRNSIEAKNISYEDAKAFKSRYSFPHSTVGISIMGTGSETIVSKSVKTNPNVRVMGVDQNYLATSQTVLAAGRNISRTEEEVGANVCILGFGIAKKFFKTPEKALGEIVSVGLQKVRIIGVAAEKGGSMFMDADNLVLLPLQSARMFYGGNTSYGISVVVDNVAYKKIASEEAEGLFRVIRKVPLGSENNFSVATNDGMTEELLGLVGYIGIAAMVIAIVTLLGSIIGLMNIMLVSVVERTREIGISKALGARSSVIRQQFLLESVIISLMGGFLGIVFSLLIGIALSSSFKVAFVIPWAWILLGVTVCSIVGVISGIYPALKASKLDPIVALRTA